MPLSDRQHDAFDNPAMAMCRAGNLRVLREAAYRPRLHERSKGAETDGREKERQTCHPGASQSAGFFRPSRNAQSDPRARRGQAAQDQAAGFPPMMENSGLPRQKKKVCLILGRLQRRKKK